MVPRGVFPREPPALGAGARLQVRDGVLQTMAQHAKVEVFTELGGGFGHSFSGGPSNQPPKQGWRTKALRILRKFKVNGPWN